MGEKASSLGRDAAGIVRRDESDANDLIEVAGAIKWFDVAKGYGFILPDDAATCDILLHVTCLRRDGFPTALEGARVVCLARKGERVMQAFRALSMDTSPAVLPSYLEPCTHVSVITDIQPEQ